MTKFFDSYIGTSEEERQEMLKEIGYDSIIDLFSDIPKDILLKSSIDIPGPFSEAELTRLFAKIAAKNKNSDQILSFLGGGVRQQYIPAAIEEVMRRGELYTSYTPYQPEISQGMLQLIYEYQSMVAELLDMDVVNASMYDWGSALGEAAFIMMRVTKKTKVILAHPISPKRVAVAKSYALHSDIELEVLEAKDGNIDFEELHSIFEEEEKRDKKERTIAGVYFEIPTFYGTLPDYPEKFCHIVHNVQAMVTVGIDPISVGILSPPGEYGADIVVGEGQMLGNPVSSGGPLLGILATKFNRKWLREMPGRLIGVTTELDTSSTGYCITLQTREQHIRREKATSNICTNQSITAVNAAIYLAALGKNGLVELASSLYDKAHFLASELGKLDNIKSPLFSPYFSEFVIEVEGISHEDLEKKCMEKGVIPGIRLEDDGCKRLIGVNELHTKADLLLFTAILREVS